MSIVTNASIPLKLFGAVLALALIAAVAVAITLTAGPTQAQTADNTYTDPQPCGPGAGTASMEEPHERTEGRFYLFDAYWEWLPPEPAQLPGQEPVNAGFLHNNECPLWWKTTEGTDDRGRPATITTLTAEDIDIDEAIFHVLDVHKATVVASASENPSGVEIALDEYPDLDRFVDADDEVYWLRLDDPDTTVDGNGDPINETSDLTLGFSTRQLDGQYWAKQDGNGNAEPPLGYRLSAERHPTRPYDHPHFLTYRAPKANDGVQSDFVWSSAHAGVGLMEMEPGTDVENLQWIFTKPGTYEIWVELVGYVRRDNPLESGDEGYDANWKPVSENVTETSVPRRYVFQVGTALDENEPPVFGVNLTAPENAVAGTLVGDPIPIFEGEAGTFYYSLSGEGHEQFAVEAIADPHSVQIKVADGADLDYETEPSYELRVNVTDRIDHESNPDLTIDDTLAVRIALEDEEPSVTLSTTPGIDLAVGQRARIDATLDTSDIPDGHTPLLTWYAKRENEADWSAVNVLGEPWRQHHANVHPHSHPGSESFKVKMSWGTGSVWSNVVTLTWRESQ